MIFHVYRSAKRVSQTSVSLAMRKASISSHTPHKKSLNKTLIVSTITFIILTLPTAIASFYFVDWIQTEEGNLLINLFDDLSFTYHGCNFFILTIMNRKFREMTWNMILRRPTNNSGAHKSLHTN